ncbi:MAG TPA: CAP domain-containing protein [Gaiellaceae bacterium]|nr:CAP domain-containing protein [Gaiellaceae bacterium]
MAPVTAAARVRVLAAAGLAALLAVALVVAGRADGAGTAWSAYLAPTSACRSADDSAAPAAVQVRAVTCLVNWARTHDSRKRLIRRPALQLAATLKGERVASCGQFSHTPCGSAVTAAVHAAGYRYATFGENLFAGTWGQVSARDVVSAWLQSPEHRANILGPRFKDLGAAPVLAHGLLDGGDAVVWTATFGSRR